MLNKRNNKKMKGYIMSQQTINYVGISKDYEESKTKSFGFYFTTEENNDIVYTNTFSLKYLVNDLKTRFSLPNSYMASSSMDFATEEGFYHNGAASMVLSLASRIADSGKSISEYTKNVLNDKTDIRQIEFADLKKEEAEDWYTDGKVAFN
tara:strand:+ start:181 stop:633 length:453 start_codon:yes stop_codon:yes gene_type:complete